MDRRRFLALLPVGLGGCASSNPATPTANETTATQTAGPDPAPVTNATRRDGGSRYSVGPDGLEPGASTVASYVVGDGAARPTDVEPHYVVVQNQTDGERQTRLSVRDRAASEPALDSSVSLPAGGIAEVELAEPAAYNVSVTVSGTTRTVSIEASRFDCNDSTTGVYVRGDGTIDETTVSTMLGCSEA